MPARLHPRLFLGKLCNIVERLFARFYASARPGARPGIILFVQTFGDLVNFNPHIHVLAADGAFDADGGFSVLPPIPRKLLEASFRKGVLDLLRREGLVSDLLAERMLAWRHTGFSVHSAVPDLPPRSRHRLNSVCEERVRCAQFVHCPSGAKRIDCHVDFYQ